MLYNGHCYYIVEADLNWADAQVCSYLDVSWQSVLFSFCLVDETEYPEKTTDFPQVTDKVDHIMCCIEYTSPARDSNSQRYYTITTTNKT